MVLWTRQGKDGWSRWLQCIWTVQEETVLWLNYDGSLFVFPDCLVMLPSWVLVFLSSLALILTVIPKQ